jgi:hypothetical protein
MALMNITTIIKFILCPYSSASNPNLHKSFTHGLSTKIFAGFLKQAGQTACHRYLIEILVSYLHSCFIILYYKVVQICPGQTVTCLHTISPGHI